MGSLQPLDAASLGDAELGNTRSRPLTGSSPWSHDFEVTWRNLNYVVEKAFWSRTFAKLEGHANVERTRTILRGMTGQFKSGQLTALMGPSGAGKSTLLECVCGIRREGRSGEVILSSNKKVNMAFIPQQDHFMALLTVREAMTYACQLQNSALPDDDDMAFTSSTDGGAKAKKDPKFHEETVQRIIDQLGLAVCSETRISNCSGGQLKRYSIAQELVAKPQILILDEPTSGLDSSSCYQTVELLYNLTQQRPPIAIVATIHQPSAKVFNLFHKIYILSVAGKCIYDDAPGKLVDHLKMFNIVVPQFYNPADYVLEVAAGDYGRQPLEDLAAYHEEASKNLMGTTLSNSARSSHKNLDDMIVPPHFPFFTHLWILFKRSLICMVRDPLLFLLRIAMHVVTALFIGLLYGNQSIGQRGGCPPDLKDFNDPSKLADVQDHMEEEIKATTNNLGNWFFAIIFIQFGAMLTTVLTFPLEMSAFAKERTNGWYGPGSYYIAKTFADIPLQFVCPILYLIIMFYMTGQIREFDRFMMISLIFILMALVAQSQGMLVGAIFMTDVIVAVFVAPLVMVPFMLFSGFFIKLEYIPKYLLPVSDLAYTRYAFEGITTAVYGFDRCGENQAEMIETMKQRLSLFLSNVFRIALSNDDGDYEYEDENKANDEEGIKNMTKTLVKGIITQLSGSTEIVDGKLQSGVMAAFKLSDSSFWPSCLALFLFFIVFRLVTYYFVYTRATTRK